MRSAWFPLLFIIIGVFIISVMSVSDDGNLSALLSVRVSASHNGVYHVCVRVSVCVCVWYSLVGLVVFLSSICRHS